MKIKWLGLAVFLMVSQVSFAQIGDDVSALNEMAERPGVQRLKAVVGEKFDVHVLQNQAHKVKYYVGKDNRIFCETWGGQSPPDLSETLGSYYEEYKSELSKIQRKGQRHHVVNTSNIYVERHGMMRNIKGKACVYSYKPANVSLGEIK